jgi:hypothetical protein
METDMNQTKRVLATITCIAMAAAAGHAGPPRLIYFDENGGPAGPRGLYDFDPSTGISTLRTPVDGSQRFFGLHVRPGTDTVYALAVLPTTLYTIDINSGATTLIGPMGGDTIADIAFDPLTGTLYGVGRNAPYTLYSIDSATGAPTALRTLNESVRCGMVSDPSGQFYGFSIGGVLSSFDPATGATTLIGGTSVGSVVEDAVFASDGQIYFTLFDGRLFRADPATGLNTFLGQSNLGTGLLGLIEEPDQSAPCYANCDGSTTAPVLNVDDFTCFVNEFAAAQSLPIAQQIASYANCDASTIAPVLNVDDFTCFINAFAQGCP